MPRIPVRIEPYSSPSRQHRHFKNKRDQILRALGKAAYINGSHFAILWVSARGEVETYASDALQSVLGEWFDHHTTEQAREVVRRDREKKAGNTDAALRKALEDGDADPAADDPDLDDDDDAVSAIDDEQIVRADTFDGPFGGVSAPPSKRSTSSSSASVSSQRRPSSTKVTSKANGRKLAHRRKAAGITPIDPNVANALYHNQRGGDGGGLPPLDTATTAGTSDASVLGTPFRDVDGFACQATGLPTTGLPTTGLSDRFSGFGIGGPDDPFGGKPLFSAPLSMGSSSLPSPISLPPHSVSLPTPSPTVVDSPVPLPATVTLASPAESTAFLETKFKQLQQLCCKIVAKAWIKVIEPKKQTRCPYNRGEEGKPEWWPKDVRHKEPDHLMKPERINLLMTILRSPRVQIARLELATAEVAAFIPSSRVGLLKDIYRVAREEERLRQQGRYKAPDELGEGEESGWPITLTVCSGNTLEGYDSDLSPPQSKSKKRGFAQAMGVDASSLSQPPPPLRSASFHGVGSQGRRQSTSTPEIPNGGALGLTTMPCDQAATQQAAPFAFYPPVQGADSEQFQHQHHHQQRRQLTQEQPSSLFHQQQQQHEHHPSSLFQQQQQQPRRQHAREQHEHHPSSLFQHTPEDFAAASAAIAGMGNAATQSGGVDISVAAREDVPAHPGAPRLHNVPLLGALDANAGGWPWQMYNGLV